MKRVLRSTTIGLLTALLTVTATGTLQQPVQAQEAPPNFSPLAKDKNGVCTQLPQGVFYEEFGGITFSSEQKSAYREIEAKINKRYNAISEEQFRLLTKEYGKYAKFYTSKATVYSPEQIAEGKRIGRDFEAQTMAILTPEQQKIYKVNLALQERMRDCGPRDSPFDRIISSLPY